MSVKLHQVSDFRLLFILIILLIAFLGFNMRLLWRKEASIFMGDSGSTFIAFLLAWFAIDLSQQNSALIKPMTILWIMAFPLFDLINVIVLRVRQKIDHCSESRSFSPCITRRWFKYILIYLIIVCIILAFRHFWISVKLFYCL